MRRLFLILASIAGLMLVADLISRLLDSSVQLAWPSVVASLVVHGLSLATLWASGRRVEPMARSARLPDWVEAQVEKNQWKARVAATGGVAFLILTVCLGGPEGWPLAIVAASLAFQVGAFAGEFVILGAQARLLGEVLGWVEMPVGRLDKMVS